jgi:hypothetical protein
MLTALAIVSTTELLLDTYSTYDIVVLNSSSYSIGHIICVGVEILTEQLDIL